MSVRSVVSEAESLLRLGAFDEIEHLVPEGDGPLRLQVIRAIARQATTERRPSVLELTELMDRVRTEEPRSLPLAAQALACEQRLVGDAGVVITCAEILAPVAAAEAHGVEALVTAVRNEWTDGVDRLAISELLRIAGQIALLVEAAGGADLGLVRIEAGIELASERGSTASERAWLAYLEVLLFRRRALDVVLDVRAHAMELWRSGHQNAALRIGELAILHYYAGLYDDARTWIERARNAAAEHGNDLAILPLEALSVTLDVIADPTDDTLLDLFEVRIERLLDHPHLAPFHRVYASQFGLLVLDQGRVEAARRFGELGERSPTRFGSAAFSLATEHLRARLRALDDLDGGIADLERLCDDAVGAGRTQLARLAERDLEQLRRDAAPSEPVENATVITTLAPTLTVRRPDGEVEPLRGQPAHVLALIIASGGAVAMDVVLESVWPGVDPSVGRNRLHGILHRLRRSLGIDADGPLRCGHDVIEMEADPRLRCDVWEVGLDVLHGEAPRFLSEQFPYDDRIEAFRRSPSRRR